MYNDNRLDGELSDDWFYDEYYDEIESPTFDATEDEYNPLEIIDKKMYFKMSVEEKLSYLYSKINDLLCILSSYKDVANRNEK